MNTQQIMQVINDKALPDSCLHADYLETPDSWVIRSDHYVFKIRKPEQSTGLDLSMVEDRREICKKELKLNKMLTKNVYMKVIPITQINKEIHGETDSNIEILDYALKMKRLDENIKLITGLRNNSVTEDQVKDIATAIAEFHKKTDIIKNTFNVTRFQNEFADICRCDLFVRDLLGEDEYSSIYESIKLSKKILNDHRYYIQERTITGFIRDGHGDLSAENIFLKKRPLIIDRVVVSDEQRQIDVLFDIARLGVDFDYYGMHNIDKLFFENYIKAFGDKNSMKTQDLYTYFKLYRTNLLITRLVDESTIFHWTEAEKNILVRYFDLYKKYMNLLGN
jgi:uncharacterized protein